MKEKLQNTTEIQRIIKDYYKESHANKFGNLQRTDKFLGIQKKEKIEQTDY